ncbi:MAG: hypothetical protein V3U26_04925 [Dehalococcoidia bacterium]
MTETETQDYPKYFIDPEWYRQGGMSLSTLLDSRIQLLGEASQKRKAKKKKKGRVTEEEALLASLGDRRPEGTDFIPPDLPILEAVFRVFLMEGNQPLTPEEIKDRLMDWWREAGAYKDVEPYILKRLLDNDRYYGFRQATAQG